MWHIIAKPDKSRYLMSGDHKCPPHLARLITHVSHGLPADTPTKATTLSHLILRVDPRWKRFGNDQQPRKGSPGRDPSQAEMSRVLCFLSKIRCDLPLLHRSRELESVVFKSWSLYITPYPLTYGNINGITHYLATRWISCFHLRSIIIVFFSGRL